MLFVGTSSFSSEPAATELPFPEVIPESIIDPVATQTSSSIVTSLKYVYMRGYLKNQAPRQGLQHLEKSGPYT
jgi:hypothetical protein